MWETLRKNMRRYSYPGRYSSITMARDSKFLCCFVRMRQQAVQGHTPRFLVKKQLANGFCATVCDDVCMLHASLKHGYHARPLCVPPQTHLLLTPQRRQLGFI